MRRLDYSNAAAVDDDDVNTQDDHDAAQHDADPKFTSPLPTTPQSRGRSTLSSRTSLLGRRLAEERSRNHQLSVELEHVKSLLAKETKRNNDNIVFDLNEIFYSSSPVNTPTTTPIKGRDNGSLQSTPLAVINEGSYDESDNNDIHIHHRIQELEVALEIETKLRKETQAKVIELEQQQISIENATNKYLQIGADSPIHEYLQRASNLINTNETNSTSNNTPSLHCNGNCSYNSLQSIDEDDEEVNIDSDNDRKNEISHSEMMQKMQEYEELVTAFHSEQQKNQEEFLSKDDVVWFFEELKWRFADINSGMSSVANVAIRSDVKDNREEWRKCLIGLVDELEYSMQQAKQEINDHLDKVETNVAADEMEAAMKSDYKERIAKYLQRIQQLEAETKDKDHAFTSKQEKIIQDRHFIEEEKKKLMLSKDGTAARIRYLETMVQSLQEKLKKMQAKLTLDKDTSNGIDNATNKYKNEIDSLASALADSELKRAHLIEEFQRERQKYILQYKQMNEVLKQFVSQINI